MNQLSLESIALTYRPYVSRTAVTLAVICALSALLYSIFLLEAVAQTASRTSAERQMQDISSQLSVLEGQYLAAAESLTPDRAQALGLVVPVTVSTVVLGNSADSLSFVGH